MPTGGGGGTLEPLVPLLLDLSANSLEKKEAWTALASAVRGAPAGWRVRQARARRVGPVTRTRRRRIGRLNNFEGTVAWAVVVKPVKMTWLIKIGRLNS